MKKGDEGKEAINGGVEWIVTTLLAGFLWKMNREAIFSNFGRKFMLFLTPTIAA